MGEVADAGDTMLSVLQARPDDETPWLSIRRAVYPLIERYADQPERVLRSARLVKATPALATLHHEKLASWREVLRPEVARRFSASPDDTTDPRPDALIAAALGCLDAAVAAWAASDGIQPLTQIFDYAVDAIG